MNEELDLATMLDDFETEINYPSLVDEAINKLVTAEENEIIIVEGTEIMLSNEFSKAFKLLNELNDKCSNALSDAKKLLVQLMQKAYQQTGSQKATNNGVTITYKIPTVKETFDTASFSKDYPDLYKKYTQTSTVKESILVKVKGDK